MKAVQPVIASNGFSFLQMRSVGSHSKSGKQEEGKKERTVKCFDIVIFFSITISHSSTQRYVVWYILCLFCIFARGVNFDFVNSLLTDVTFYKNSSHK